MRTVDLDMHSADDDEANATVMRVADLGERIRLEATVDGGPTLRADVPRHALRPTERGVRVRIEARVQRVYQA